MIRNAQRRLLGSILVASLFSAPLPPVRAILFEGGALQGVVADETGMPVARAIIQLYSPSISTPELSCYADHEGRFVLTAIPVGVYEVSAERSGFARQVYQGVQLQAGQEEYLRFTLVPSRQVEEEERRGSATGRSGSADGSAISLPRCPDRICVRQSLESLAEVYPGFNLLPAVGLVPWNGRRRLLEVTLAGVSLRHPFSGDAPQDFDLQGMVSSLRLVPAAGVQVGFPAGLGRVEMVPATGRNEPPFAGEIAYCFSPYQHTDQDQEEYRTAYRHFAERNGNAYSFPGKVDDPFGQDLDWRFRGEAGRYNYLFTGRFVESSATDEGSYRAADYRERFSYGLTLNYQVSGDASLEFLYLKNQQSLLPEDEYRFQGWNSLLTFGQSSFYIVRSHFRRTPDSAYWLSFSFHDGNGDTGARNSAGDRDRKQPEEYIPGPPSAAFPDPPFYEQYKGKIYGLETGGDLFFGADHRFGFRAGTELLEREGGEVWPEYQEDPNTPGEYLPDLYRWKMYEKRWQLRLELWDAWALADPLRLVPHINWLYLPGIPDPQQIQGSLGLRWTPHRQLGLHLGTGTFIHQLNVKYRQKQAADEKTTSRYGDRADTDLVPERYFITEFGGDWSPGAATSIRWAIDYQVGKNLLLATIQDDDSDILELSNRGRENGWLAWCSLTQQWGERLHCGMTTSYAHIRSSAFYADPLQPVNRTPDGEKPLPWSAETDIPNENVVPLRSTLWLEYNTPVLLGVDFWFAAAWYSGLPKTPEDEDPTRELIHDEIGKSWWSLDGGIRSGILRAGRFKTDLSLQVDNLLDQFVVSCPYNATNFDSPLPFSGNALASRRIRLAVQFRF